MRKSVDVYAERQRNGSLLLSAMVEGYRVKREYYYYTMKEAKADFRKRIQQSSTPS